MDGSIPSTVAGRSTEANGDLLTVSDVYGRTRFVWAAEPERSEDEIASAAGYTDWSHIDTASNPGFGILDS